MASVHRRVQLLVGHLDLSGLFGGGSTVAWGGSGDLVRLHLVVCGSEVGGHIVGVRWAGVSQGAGKRRRERKQGERSRPRSRRDLGGTEARGRASHMAEAWLGRRAGQPHTRHALIGANACDETR